MNKSDIAKSHYDLYTRYRDDSREWRERRDKCKKAYLGEQTPQDLSTKYKGRGQVDIVINKLRPLLRNRAAMMIASKPIGKMYGISAEEMESAQALEDLVEYLLYTSHWQIKAERVCMASQREGVGYFVIAPDYKADYGRGELKIYDESYRHIYLPKDSGREWDFSDAPRIIHTKLVSKEDFVLRFPKMANKIDGLLVGNDEIYYNATHQGDESAEVDLPQSQMQPEFIREIDTYEKFYQDVQVLYYVPTGTIRVLDDDYTPTDADNRLIQAGLIQINKAPVPRIRFTKSASGKAFLETEILPIENYPIIPVIGEDTGNALPMGEIDFQIGLQELLNKSASIVLLNAALSSNFRIIMDAVKAGVKDVNEFKRRFAIPGNVEDMKMDPLTGKFPFEIFKPEPLNQAFWMWMEKMGYEIQNEISIFSLRTGDTTNAPNTYGATLQIGEWANDALRIPLNHLELAIQRLYDVLFQWTPVFYDIYKEFPITQENVERTTQFVNKPQFDNAGEIIARKNDISSIRAKYRVRMGSTMPSQTTAYMLLYQQLASLNPVFLKHLVKYLPIKEVEKKQIMQEIDVVPKLQQELQQRDQMLKVMQGEMQRVSEASDSKDKALEVEKFRGKLNDKLKDVDLQLSKALTKAEASRRKGEKK